MPQDEFTALETKLRRSLMPVALSEPATTSIHSMLDELAGVKTISSVVPKSPGNPKTIPWYAAAAAVAGLLAISPWLASPALEKIGYHSNYELKQSIETTDQNMRIIDESTHLAWFEDEGWIDDPDGGALHAVRMRVVEEDRLLDEETGLIVHIFSPREEMLLMPVSTF